MKKNYLIELCALVCMTLVVTVGGSRVIDEKDSVRAMKLCVASGIDIKQKRNWRDRAKLSNLLGDGELKKWLLEQ